MISYPDRIAQSHPADVIAYLAIWAGLSSALDFVERRFGPRAAALLAWAMLAASGLFLLASAAQGQVPVTLDDWTTGDVMPITEILPDALEPLPVKTTWTIESRPLPPRRDWTHKLRDWGWALDLTSHVIGAEFFGHVEAGVLKPGADVWTVAAIDFALYWIVRRLERRYPHSRLLRMFRAESGALRGLQGLDNFILMANGESYL